MSQNPTPTHEPRPKGEREDSGSLTLHAERLELEWENWMPGDRPGRVVFKALISGPTKIEARIFTPVINTGHQYRAGVKVDGLSEGTQARQHWDGDDPEALKRQCEEFAGLAIALLGLERPEGR